MYCSWSLFGSLSWFMLVYLVSIYFVRWFPVLIETKDKVTDVTAIRRLKVHESMALVESPLFNNPCLVVMLRWRWVQWKTSLHHWSEPWHGDYGRPWAISGWMAISIHSSFVEVKTIKDNHNFDTSQIFWYNPHFNLSTFVNFAPHQKGVDFKTKFMQVRGKKLKLALWDTASAPGSQLLPADVCHPRPWKPGLQRYGVTLSQQNYTEEPDPPKRHYQFLLWHWDATSTRSGLTGCPSFREPWG